MLKCLMADKQDQKGKLAEMNSPPQQFMHRGMSRLLKQRKL